MFSFLEDFDQAVEEGCEPEEPLQGGCAQNEAHYRHVDNLIAISSWSCRQILCRNPTSDTGHFDEVEGSLAMVAPCCG